MFYINGIGAISPQHSDNTPGSNRPIVSYQNAFSCIEPDYKSFINPKQLRRMSRIVKMGVTAALMALKDARIDMPDAVITGTGLGCLSDTETFLSALIVNNESFLNPAPFIHSTHNTISSQIALLLKCTRYNQTYSHGALSFESALLDSILLLQEDQAQTVLVGGVDELTETLKGVHRRFGVATRKGIDSSELFESEHKGTLPGEGAAFLVLSKKKSQNCYGALKELLISPESGFNFEKQLHHLLNKNQLHPNDLDLYLLGKNGDSQNDSVYRKLEKGVLKNCRCETYKHLCGEYDTASAFALWLALGRLNRSFPGPSKSKGNLASSRQIVIYNHTQALKHSLMLVEAF